MKCGTAVIVGNKTSLPEVVGDAALLVDPFNVDEIASAIEQVLTDSSLRSRLRSKGLDQAKLFDWRDTARKTLVVYNKAAGLESS
jgi:glycosyltransferase involved in cell wall biosynthesis